MKEETNATEKNETWQSSTLPEGHKPISVKWIFKIKKSTTGEVKRYKARLVAKSYTHIQGVGYDEIFVLVARMETIKLLISIAA
ncbi:cysteine-rich RLK (RECEPTOR-like protein kinase) 8 [Hibiscus trionum]|uniref:Cysteine-rich RLK (RECEPTOR-like protein kinase) 8 n=1 Tax=Hibiscus trionum TaxID=183268 RepID=A0A9W7HIW3_HIBTR|nr:cysteine-rich RLK (RECEPTOR-like protein kinase) 8 [Hibiscus trionum]